MTARMRCFAGTFFGLLIALGLPGIALAHDSPEGGEWILADWMFLSFIAFAGSAFVMFLVALKTGLLSNLEEAKYPILDIEEEDYYTPDWAMVDDDDLS